MLKRWIVELHSGDRTSAPLLINCLEEVFSETRIQRCESTCVRTKSAFQNLQCASRDGNIYFGGRGAGRVRCGDAALRLDQVGDER